MSVAGGQAVTVDHTHVLPLQHIHDAADHCDGLEVVLG